MTSLLTERQMRVAGMTLLCVCGVCGMSSVMRLSDGRVASAVVMLALALAANVAGQLLLEKWKDAR